MEQVKNTRNYAVTLFIDANRNEEEEEEKTSANVIFFQSLRDAITEFDAVCDEMNVKRIKRPFPLTRKHPAGSLLTTWLPNGNLSLIKIID